MRKNKSRIRLGLAAMSMALLGLLLISGCRVFDSGPAEKPKPPICDKAMVVEAGSNEIQGTFYPGSKWEQAKDLLDPQGSYHKYGMKFHTTVHLSNPNDADWVVKRSVGHLMIKNENMDQKNYEAILPEFILKAQSDTVVHFEFRVDIASLSMDYFKMIASNEKVGYFFKSSHKYAYAENAICSDTSLIAGPANASDTTIQDYVSIPEVADATYQGIETAAETSTASAKWTVDNWDTIRCTLMVLVLILGIVLGGHAGPGVC